MILIRRVLDKRELEADDSCVRVCDEEERRKSEVQVRMGIYTRESPEWVSLFMRFYMFVMALQRHKGSLNSCQCPRVQCVWGDVRQWIGRKDEHWQYKRGQYGFYIGYYELRGNTDYWHGIL